MYGCTLCVPDACGMELGMVVGGHVNAGEPNLGPLEEQKMLFTSEPPSPLPFSFPVRVTLTPKQLQHCRKCCNFVSSFKQNISVFLFKVTESHGVSMWRFKTRESGYM